MARVHKDIKEIRFMVTITIQIMHRARIGLEWAGGKGGIGEGWNISCTALASFKRHIPAKAPERSRILYGFTRTKFDVVGLAIRFYNLRFRSHAEPECDSNIS